MDDARPLAEDGLRIALAHHGDTSLPTAMAWRARARLRMAEQRDGEARADLDQTRATFERMGKGGEAYLPMLDVLYGILDARAPR